MCSGSEAASYLRLIDFVSLNSRLERNEQAEEGRGTWAMLSTATFREQVTSTRLLDRPWVWRRISGRRRASMMWKMVVDLPVPARVSSSQAHTVEYAGSVPPQFQGVR